jgi:hypothetical protein
MGGGIGDLPCDGVKITVLFEVGKDGGALVGEAGLQNHRVGHEVLGDRAK